MILIYYIRSLSVIIGVRFAKTQGVLYLQIQTGKLLPFGNIDPSTVKWQDPPGDLTSNFFEIDYDSRGFSLGNLHMDDHVLTGIKLENYVASIVHSVVGKRILNLATGELEQSSSGRVYNENEILHFRKLEGTKVGLDGGNRRYIVKGSVKKNSWDYMIQFIASDFDTDRGQTLVPFFDGNNIELDIPRPLSGIGFILYTNAGHAGYIRPVLKTFNYKFLISN